MIVMSKAGVASPQLAVDVPFERGVIPPSFPRFAPHVHTNFLRRFDGAGREYSRVYGPLSELGTYLLHAWSSNPLTVLTQLADAYDYAATPGD